MKKYTLLEDGSYRNNKTGYSGIRPGHWMYEDVEKWLAEGNTPDPQFSDAELAEQSKLEAIRELDREMLASIPAFVNVETTDGAFCMDAGKDHAWKLNEGIMFAELAGLPTLDIVDYNNKVHTGVSLAACREIVVAQAASHFTAFMKRARDRELLL